MLIQGQVGPTTGIQSIANGIQSPIRLGNMGDIITSALHGRYYEANYRKNLFSVANQTASATTAGFATTYTGLCVSNPNRSPVNLVLLKVGYSFILAQTSAFTIGIMTGLSPTNVTHTTPLSPRSNFIGNISGYGLAGSAATLPIAPVLTTVLGSVDTGALTTHTIPAPCNVDLEGSIILQPGAFACFYTTSASVAASFIGSIMWEEIPE